MPEDSFSSPETPPPNSFGRRVGTGLAGETTRSEGHTILPDPNQHPLDVIGDFEVLGKLGQGGMGAVYRARQVSLHRQVALKILPVSLEADAEFVTRFQREARIAASLSHANLVKVYTSGQADGCHYIAMELIEGETLGDWLKRGALPPSEALRMILDVAQALECGWRTAQLIHRDIKPGNIFLSAEGAVKLGDLGLAKTTDGNSTGLTQTGTAMGTPHYISPEQARGDRDLDFRADIYSLGCTLYQMLTGQTPYSGSAPMVVMSQHINAPPPAILKVMPQCPIPLARLVSKMLKKQRRERHASYEELIAQIESVRALLDPTLVTPSFPATGQYETPLPAIPSSHTAIPAPPAGQRSKKTVLYGSIAVGVVVLGLAAWLAWPKEEKLTAAQRWAREHGAQTATGSPPPEGSNPVKLNRAASTLSSPPVAKAESWQPLLADAEWKAVTKDHELKDGLLNVHGGVGKPQPSTDGAIRARFPITAESMTYPSIFLRDSSDAAYKLVWTKGNGVVVLNFFSRSKKETIEIGRYALPKPLAVGETALLELRIQGTHLTAKVNGAPAIACDDNRLAMPGVWGVNADNVSFESVEVQSLPATSEVTARPDSQATRLWDTPQKLPNHKGVTWENGGVRLTRASLKYEQTIARDAILRVSVQMNADLRGPQLALRLRDTQGTGDFYRLMFNDTNRKLELRAVKLGKSSPLREWPLPGAYRPDEWLKLELWVVGDEITVVADGQSLGSVRDSAISEPGVAMLWADNALFRDVEYVPLDGAGGPVASTPAATAERWQDLLHDPAKLVLTGAVERTPEGLRFTDAGSAKPNLKQGPQRDGAVRLRAVFDGLRPKLLARTNTAGLYRLYLKDAKAIVLDRYDNGTKQTIGLREFPAPAPFHPGQDYAMELRVVGQTLTATLDGEVLGMVTDGTLSEGYFFVATTEHNAGVLVKSLEVLDLDAPGGWISLMDRIDAAADVVKGEWTKAGEVLRATTPNAVGQEAGLLQLPYEPAEEYDFRIAYTTTTGKPEVWQILQGNGHAFRWTTAYALLGPAFDVVAGQPVSVRRAGKPPASQSTTGEPCESLVEVRRDRVTGYLNGQKVEELKTDYADMSLNGNFALREPRRLGVGVWTNSTLFHDISVREITGKGKLLRNSIAPTSAMPVAAQREVPFVNTLGMKFVPVPILVGSAAGQPVLFSVWNTRVQDYEVFARETKREWNKPDFEQGPTHPAVEVNWDDAQAFCAWLTERDRKAARIGANERYRLPSDHEWSCAVGIGQMEDAEKPPAESNLKIRDNFPWGSQWPLPAGAGNYAGEELRPALTEGKYTHLKGVIAGYDDGFVNTSPVGSFAANRFGLYDMGGNVWQWCQDWFDKDQKRRVLRGASWDNYDRSSLCLSNRFSLPPGERHHNDGFRCVLTSVSSNPPTAAGEPGAIKLWDSPDQLRKMDGVSWESDAMRLENVLVENPTPVSANAILRASIRMNADGQSVSLCLRGASGKDHDSRYSVGLIPGAHQVQLHVFDNGRRMLQAWPFPRAYGNEEWARLELRAVGDELTVSLDGKVLGSVHDSTLTKPGNAQLYAKAKGFFRDIQYVPLDGSPSEASAIRLWDAPDKISTNEHVRWEDNALNLNGASVKYGDVLSRDVLVRVAIRMNPDAQVPEIGVRRSGETQYELKVTRGEIPKVVLAFHQVSKTIELGSWPLLRKYGLDEWVHLELRAVGEEFTVFADGQVLGSVRDSTLLTAGGIMLYAYTNGYFRDVVYVPLDQTHAPEPWQDVLHDQTRLSLDRGERTSEGLRFAGAGSAMIRASKGQPRNGAVRLRAAFSGSPLIVRARATENGGVYNLVVADGKVYLERYDFVAKRGDRLGTYPLSEFFQLGRDYELELRVVGQTLTAKLDGKVIGTAVDAAFPEGRFGVQVNDSNAAATLIKALEFLDLDTPSAISEAKP